MKRFLSALAIGVASVTLVVPAAQADTPGCVSKGEFDHVHTGMSMSRVHRLFDTNGRLGVAASGFSIRKYRPCPRHSFVRVSYRKGHVTAKAALWHVG